MYLKSGVREDTSCGLFTLRVIKSDIEVDSKGASHSLELSHHIGQTESIKLRKCISSVELTQLLMTKQVIRPIRVMSGSSFARVLCVAHF